MEYSASLSSGVSLLITSVELCSRCQTRDDSTPAHRCVCLG